jgi:hypothetical protein
MKKHALFLLLLLILAFPGCQSGEKPTPTPFPTLPALGTLPVVPVGAQGIPISLPDLLENPEFFEGALVQVTGQFGRLPRLVCGHDPHPSPATWTLQDGEAIIQAGGFDDPLYELFPPGLTMTVLGKVQHWQGPVGCGKQAVPKDFWYLDVTRLINPSQLARVTLTPAVGGELVIEGTSEESPILVETEAPEIAVTEPPAVPAPPTVFVPTAVDRDATPTPEKEEEFPGVITPTATLTIGQLIETPPGTLFTPTPSLTPLPGTTATPATAVPPNSTATVPALPTTTDRGEITFYDAFTDALLANESHNWTITLEAGETITVSVIAEPELNPGIRLLSPTGTQVTEQNQALAGQVESLRLNPTTAGEYVLQIFSTGGRAGRYYVSLWDEFGDYRPMGILQSGVRQTGAINDVITHVWFFSATAGQLLNVQTTSSAGSDLLLFVINPADQLLTYQSASINSFPLPLTGWYALELEEYLLEQNTYQITLTLQ